MHDITSTIVAFKTDEKMLKRAAKSFLNNPFNMKLFIIDNSSDDRLKNALNGPNIEYIFNNGNGGFGAAHNQIIRKVQDKSKYHLLLNPDIYFRAGELEKIYNFMESNTNVGLVMPKILFPNGDLQYLCRLLPTPFDFFLRRFKFPSISKKSFFKYELRFANHDKLIYAPYLSGCFMFIRNEVFKEVGAFDERFFIYFEDVDLSRRIFKKYKTAYYPEAEIYHDYNGGSCKNSFLTEYFIFSAIKYFNKWGWFFDRERRSINKQTIEQLILK